MAYVNDGSLIEISIEDYIPENWSNPILPGRDTICITEEEYNKRNLSLLTKFKLMIKDLLDF